MARYDYNLVAVGAGAAGLVSSYIASAVKARVALIEKNLMGGDCLNYGCVPSKSLISSAKLVHQLNQHDRFGLKEIQYQVDFPLVMDRIQEIIEAITPHDSVERYTSLGVECIEGSAKLVSPHELEVCFLRKTSSSSPALLRPFLRLQDWKIPLTPLPTASGN